MAREAALKVEEAAAAWSEAYPSLEYRHGPLSTADEDTVVWLFGVDDDVLVNDIRRTGATVVVTEGDPQAELVLTHGIMHELLSIHSKEELDCVRAAGKLVGPEGPGVAPAPLPRLLAALE